MAKKPLEEYKEKRHFEETTEPESVFEETGMNRFVVQEHNASHLHWDFRLEMEGVLKSWAVPKGIPIVPNVRRLAVQVEDHPVGYINFEGTIPEGQYGAGTVSIWDRGTYQLCEKTEKVIEVILNGEKLNGEYVLVHTGGENWLIFKKRKAES